MQFLYKTKTIQHTGLTDFVKLLNKKSSFFMFFENVCLNICLIVELIGKSIFTDFGRNVSEFYNINKYAQNI